MSSFSFSSGKPQEEFQSRFIATTILLIFAFGLLLGRVWYLQIFQGRKFREFSEKNRINVKRIPAMRGRILDRHGQVIADSRASYDLILSPTASNPSVRESVFRLASILNWKDEERDHLLDEIRPGIFHDPVVAKRDLTRDEVARVLARQYLLRGVDIIHSPARDYPYEDNGSHMLGYLGEINQQELRRIRESGNTIYQLGDVWGISGVEKTYETDLRGQYGARPFVEDAWGRELGEEFSSDLLPDFRPRKEVPGRDLLLAIDLKVQEAAEKAFTHQAGAVVAIDPHNGDVLALVSRPEYSPEQFVRGVSSRYWQELTRDPLNPLYDRALRGLYPPGSTFKIVTGAAALEEKVTNPQETVFCKGSYRLGREVKRCWKKEGHGAVQFHRAMVESCDVYFYEMGRRLGIERIAKYGKGFGLGRATGIGINREENGLVPTEEWKQRVYRQPWVGGETLSVAIGQGALQVTPLQLSSAVAAVLNGGTLYQPRLVLKSRKRNGEDEQVFPTVEKGKLILEESFRRELLTSLAGVVNEPGGTAYWHARSERVKIGGKTGTAQVVGRRSGIFIEDHAWFVAFAPIDDPKIVITVIVENGGHGGTTAAPIAKKVIEAFLGGTS